MLLEARDIVKVYPGVRALDGVSFELERGEIHALVGENGAGKSTLMHALAGVTRPDEGTILLDGAEVSFESPAEAAERGIGVVFQELSLSESLSIAENVFAARQPVTRSGLIDRDDLRRRTRELLGLFDWEVDPETPVAELSAAQRQMVEILKALARDPRVLILDEPTSSLTSAETERLFANVRRLRDRGTAVVYISHHLSDVFALADRVTVLRDGRHVDTCATADVNESALVRKMVGRSLEGMYGRPQSAPGDERLRVECGVVSLSARAGEIVGLAGLAGSGRTELGRAIFGAEPFEGGRILVDSTEVRVRTPAEAIRAGIVYLTESRKDDGLFLDRSLRDNCSAARLGAFSGRFGIMNESAMTSFAHESRERFGIASAGIDQEVGSLSGGNQQKALLAMWLSTNPNVLIADEPTRGVDVGARADIYRLLREAAGRGMAILLISSDLPEILGLSDRILVMRGGRLAGEFSREAATEERIIACAAGVTTGGIA